MNYFTCQRVRTPDGTTGLNAFAFECSGVAGDAVPNIDELASGEKAVIDRAVAVPPGGNFVDSYLDLAVTDPLPDDRVEAFRDRITDDRSTFELRDSRPGFAIAYYWSPRASQPPRDEFDALYAATCRLVASASLDPAAVIEARTTQDALVFEVVHTAASVVANPNVPNVRIEWPTLQAFQELHGSIYPHVVDALLSSNEDELIRRGGVHIVDESGADLWRSIGPRADGS